MYTSTCTHAHTNSETSLTHRSFGALGSVNFNLHCPYFSNTIAQLFRNARPPPDSSTVCHTPYNVD